MVVRLACPVWAEQAEHLPGVDVEVEPVDHGVLAVGLGQLPASDGRGGHVSDGRSGGTPRRGRPG